MYFCEIENFAYGEINERTISNPHPWTGSDRGGHQQPWYCSVRVYPLGIGPTWNQFLHPRPDPKLWLIRPRAAASVGFWRPAKGDNSIDGWQQNSQYSGWQIYNES